MGTLTTAFTAIARTAVVVQHPSDVMGTLTTAFGEKNYSNHQEASQGAVVAYSIREDAKANTFSATPIETARALQATQPSVQSHHAQTFITQQLGAEPSILMRQREGKPGGGKGPLLSEERSLTIATNNDQVLFQAVGVLGDMAHTLTAEGCDASEDGTGRGTPVVAVSDPSAFDEMNFTLGGDTHHTLRAGTKQSTGVVTISDSPLVGPLTATGMNRARGTETVESHHYAYASPTIVRRLTPTECERLQGFPDGWTAQRHDWKTGDTIEQKDSARYRQMGNAVAVPCVEWILRRLNITHHTQKDT